MNPLTDLPMQKLQIYAHFNEEMNHKKKSILCLHGWLDNHASFIPLTKYLQEYNVISIDFPGHGKSSKIDSQLLFHFGNWVFILKEFIELNFKTKIFLMGHSMGAAVASLYASVFPDDIDGLILLEGLAPLTDSYENSSQRMYNYYSSFKSNINKPLKYYETVEQAIQVRMLNSKLSFENAKILTEASLQENNNGFYFDYDIKLKLPAAIRFGSQQIIEFLKKISCPCLALTGDSGFQSLKIDLEELGPWVKNLTVDTSPGGHHFHMENPSQVADLIVRWLKKKFKTI